LRYYFFTITFSKAETPPPTSATLSGYVRDKANGETLPFVNILIKGTKIGTATNLSGYFAIPNLPIDKIKVRVSLLGYREQTFELDVNEKKITSKILNLFRKMWRCKKSLLPQKN